MANRVKTDGMRIIGRTGLNQWGGRVNEEQLRQLSGTRAIKVYQEMRDNDAIIGGFLFMIEMLVRQVKWTVKPASEDAQDVAAAEFVEECRNDMSHTWEDLMSEILSMLWAGWSYFEIVYKRRQGKSNDPTKRSRYTDGRIGWRKIEIRGQETLDRWEFDEDGGVQGMWQSAPPTYAQVFLPIERCLLFRTKSTKNNPEGRSILRNAYRSWYFKKRFEETEAIGGERDLVGMPIMEVPPQIMLPDASASDQALRAQLELAVSEIRRDEREGLLIPAEELTIDGETVKTGYKLRPFTSGGTRAVDIDKIIRRLESRIALTVMAQFMLLGQDKVGSFALASEHTDLFAVAIGAWLDQIAGVFNRYAVPRLLEVNNFQVEHPPELVPGDLEKPALEAYANYISTLVKAGVLRPGIALERHVRNMAELPEVEEDELEDEVGERRPAPKPQPEPAPDEDDDDDQQ